MDKAIAAQRQVTRGIKQPFQMYSSVVFHTVRAIMCVEFEEAERLAREAADISQQIGIAALDGIYGIHMFTIRREQGRIGEVAPLISLIVANNPESAVWRLGLGLIYSTLGQRETCKEIFDALAAEGFADVPQDSLWVSSLAYLSEIYAFLEDKEQAAILYKLLLPYEERVVVTGGATACYGAVARSLRILARTRAD